MRSVNSCAWGRFRTLLAGLLAVSVMTGAMSAATPAQAAAARNAAIVIDANTGKTLYSESADSPRYPASLTKMMTLYIVFDLMNRGKLNKNSRLKVSAAAASAPPSKLGLKAGQTITVEQAIYALVTKSANDVARTVAENIGGSESKFADMMTRQARALGMSNTIYRNASGLPDPSQKTTARDMARLGIALREHFPREYRYFSTRSFAYGGRRHANHNKLLGRVDGVDGIKTGYTRASGFNLVSSVRIGDRSIVAVVMGGKSGASRDARMRQLIATYIKKGSTKDRGDLVAKAAPVTTGVKVAAAAPALPKGLDAPIPAQRPVEVAAAAPVKPAIRPDLPVDTATRTASVTKSAPVDANGWMIQVGAVESESAAAVMLDKVRAQAGSTLSGAAPLTQIFEKNGTTYHRARFAGFESRSAALNACKSLKRKQIACFAVQG